MKRNSTVILESTIYPGVTEEVVKPILEQESGLSCGPDFCLAYSPERVNPGDEEHTLQNIIKIVVGRAINDYMPKHIAELTIKALNNAGKVIKSFFVGALNLTPLLGLTYKEDVADTRESPAKEIITELAAYGIEVLGYDPHLDNIENEFKIKKITNLNEAPKLDAIILAVAHTAFREITLEKLKNITNSQPVLIDVRRFFKPKEATEKGFYYQSL
ncbi:MAG: hypothetical protein STSR0004_08200 [Peptococcaceae bacterium]